MVPPARNPQCPLFGKVIKLPQRTATTKPLKGDAQVTCETWCSTGIPLLTRTRIFRQKSSFCRMQSCLDLMVVSAIWSNTNVRTNLLSDQICSWRLIRFWSESGSVGWYERLDETGVSDFGQHKDVSGGLYLEVMPHCMVHKNMSQMQRLGVCI